MATELRGFAEGLEKEKTAVEWSNGPVERQVNWLKVIGRTMYGRAEFPLLRGRVLWAV